MPLPILPFITGKQIFDKHLKDVLKGRTGYFKPWPRRGKTVHVPRDTCLCHGVVKKRLVVEVTGIGFYVEKCGCERSKSSRNKSRSRHRSNSSFSRYRIRNPTLQRFGDLSAGAKLGLFKVFSNNQMQSSTQLNTTGAHGGSISTERCWDSVNSGPPYRATGPFALIKTEISGAGRVNGGLLKNITSPGNWWQYEGSFVDDGDWFSDPVGNYLTTAIPTATGYDTLAWDRLKPRVNRTNLAQFLYELKDLPGQLETTANLLNNSWRSFGGGYSTVTMHPKSAAENFLNHEFGWVPFLSDLWDLYDTYNRSNEFISQLSRDNGSWVRKRAVLKSETTQRHVGRRYSAGVEPFGFQIQGLCNDFVVDGITCKGYFDLTEVVTTKVWATGHFKFYRPEFDSNDPAFGGLLETGQRLMTLYGLRITPSLLYKITPWSWTVDWFTSFGKYIDRMDDFIVDGIVSRDLCIMMSTKREMTKTSVINFAGGKRTFTWRRNVSMKVRKVADSPYGFDATWNNISVRQAAILASIGITRSNPGFISRGA